MALNIRSLLAFQAVIEAGTTTAAALRLHRTQPQISRLIAQLEGDLGFALFRRVRKRLQPTEEAIVFYRETQRAFSALSEIQSIAKDIRAHPVARLRILATVHIMNALLPDAIKRFLRVEPGFRFAIETRGRESVSYWIANRQFDVGFLSQPAEDPEVQTQLLVKAPLLAVVPAAHPLVKKTRIEPADLYRQPMIAVRRGTPIRGQLDALFGAAGITPTIRGETATVESACQFVSKGIGLTIADPFVVSLFLANPAVAVRPLATSQQIDYAVLLPRGTDENAQVNRFVACVRDTARETMAHVLEQISRPLA